MNTTLQHILFGTWTVLDPCVLWRLPHVLRWSGVHMLSMSLRAIHLFRRLRTLRELDKKYRARGLRRFVTYRCSYCLCALEERPYWNNDDDQVHYRRNHVQTVQLSHFPPSFLYESWTFVFERVTLWPYTDYNYFTVDECCGPLSRVPYLSIEWR